MNNNLCKIENRYFILLQNFIYQKIFKELPKPLCYFNNAMQQQLSNVHQRSRVNKVLAKILYDITNKLLELDDKNQQVNIKFVCTHNFIIIIMGCKVPNLLQN